MPPFCPTPSVFHPLTSSSTSSPFRPLLSHSHPRPFSLGPLSAASAGLAAAFFASSFDADDLPLTGSCGIAKIRTPSEPAAHVLPQPESAGLLGQAGEDAFFIASNGCAWGVADGVGGWSGYPGADSALYSRTLMRYALNKATEGQATLASSSPPSVTPLAILESAYASTQQHSIIGSTTACIVVYDPQAQLIHYANLGDSGLLIIRAPTTASSQPSKSRKSPAAFEKSEDRQHGFNCPFQLGHRSEDRPKDAAVAALDVRDGDLMILATVSHTITPRTRRTADSSSTLTLRSPLPCDLMASGRLLRQPQQ